MNGIEARVQKQTVQTKMYLLSMDFQQRCQDNSTISTTDAEQLDNNMQKYEFGLLPHTIYKLTQNESPTLNVRAKTRKLLVENRGVNLCDLRFSNGFSDMTPKEQSTKEKAHTIVKQLYFNKDVKRKKKKKQIN